MQLLEVVHHQQRSAYLQSIVDLADQVAATSPDMRVPELDGGHLSTGQLAGTGDQASGSGVQVQLSALDREAKKDAAVLSVEKLRQKYGQQRADRAIAVVQSQVSTARQVFTKHRKHELEGKRELGRDLAAAGIQVQQHSVKDYTHVLVTQLDLLQDGADPSVSAVVNAAFPDDPKKAASIKNSQHGKRRKQAWDSSAVMNHPMEIAMQATHGRDSMNRRHSARTFGQSLGINRAMFKSCDRITKLEARVQLLEQQMQTTKNREALADAGATSSRDKVLSLRDAGVGPTDIARQLGMNLPAVKKALQRARKAG